METRPALEKNVLNYGDTTVSRKNVLKYGDKTVSRKNVLNYGDMTFYRKKCAKIWRNDRL